jgi:hypothetical protein
METSRIDVVGGFYDVVLRCAFGNVDAGTSKQMSDKPVKSEAWWQPVKIAPAANHPHWNKYWARNEGKIIRVRPRPDWHVMGDPDVMVYEIHSEDMALLSLAPGNVAPAIMEYQIQAD